MIDPSMAAFAIPELTEMGERIVAAARVCFERYGIQKTTIEDIAKAAGVSRPTVYKHFPGKLEIVDHISMTELDKIQEGLRGRLTRRSDFAEMMTEVILVSVSVANENLYVRRFVEAMGEAAHSYAPSSPYQKVARMRWHDLLERARAKGELATDLDLDEVVAWLSLNQIILLATINEVEGGEAWLRRFIRRFVVEPLLADRGK